MSLKSLFDQTNLKLSKKKQDQLNEYAKLILEWNKTRNLVSRNANLETVNEHIFDCACLMPHIKEKNILSVSLFSNLKAIDILFVKSKIVN